jgi:FkbM family methyltransferase
VETRESYLKNRELNLYKYSFAVKPIYAFLKFFKLYRMPNYLNEFDVLCTYLENNNVDLVIDIGASIGNFSYGVRKGGFDGKIISIEPIYESYLVLRKRSLNDSNWEVFNLAISDLDGEIQFYISDNYVSSSAKNILNKHIIECPESEIIEKRTVVSNSISNFIRINAPDFKNIFIKLDTQGYDLDILNSMNDFNDIKGIKIETSLIPLYSDSGLYTDTLSFLLNRGFRLWDVIPGFRSSKNSRLLQCDLVVFQDES